MALDIEQRIIHFADTNGNTKFAEVRQYEQYTTLKAVLPDTAHTVIEFAFNGLTEGNKELWTVEIDGVEFSGTFSNAVEFTNSGLFTETISKPKTKRLDIYSK